MEFREGDHVEKYKGDYGGPGVIRKVIDHPNGTVRYTVAHAIAGGFGEFWHIYSAEQLRLDPNNEALRLIDEIIDDDGEDS